MILSDFPYIGGSILIPIPFVLKKTVSCLQTPSIYSMFKYQKFASFNKLICEAIDLKEA